jgi:hypothetical protein
VRRLAAGDLARARSLLGALLTLPVKPSRNVEAEPLARKCVERARKDVESRRDVATTDIVGLHDLRIAYKKLRYAAEILQEALPVDLAAMAKPAAQFQKRLGESIDADVAEEAIRRARGLPEATRTRALRALRKCAASASRVTSSSRAPSLRRRRRLTPEDLDLLENDVRLRAIVRGRHARDPSDEIRPRDDHAEDGVTVVEMRRRALGDEELRAVRARARVRHRQDARPRVPQLRMELVLELVARPARAAPNRIAALIMKFRNHAVENRAVVERLPAVRLARARMHPFLRARREARRSFSRYSARVAPRAE